MGGGEVAAADFLAGMAETGAAEGFGVAGTGLTAAELGVAGGAAAPSLLTSGAGTAGGISSLTPALQTAITNTAAVNAPVAAQAMQAAAAGAVPSASAALGAGQLGDLSLTDASLGSAGEANVAQAASQAQPNWQDIMAKGQQDALTAKSLYPGTQLASVGNAGVSDALARSVAGPGEAGWGMDLGTGQVPVGPAAGTVSGGIANLPVDPQAYDLGQSQIADLYGKNLVSPPETNILSDAYNAWKNSDPLIKYGSAGLAAMKYLGKPTAAYAPPGYSGPLSKINISPNYRPYAYMPYAAGGPVEEMSRENALGANTGYPQADIQQGAYATPWQTPVSRNVVTGPSDANVDQMTGEERMAGGGIASLGSYSDGGRLLKGPGDGMSDGIPATISGKQPARLADGEFVVPADVVSGLGNGSTDAGAKHLYGMMDKVRKARTGTKKQGREINPRKYLPA